MLDTIHTTDDYKTQARRLRDALAATGSKVSHAQALELVARQHGHRDWNTLSAEAGNRKAAGLSLGEAVEGSYLGQPFTGRVVALSALGGSGLSRVTVAFDTPVDVVRFDSFSALRRRATATLGHDGVSTSRTSDGEPHLRIRRRARG